MTNDHAYLVPPGFLRCFITGKLRKDTPEENVRQRWARSIVEEYGYKKSDLSIEFPVRMGSSSKRADIVVFRPGAAHLQEEIVIIVEAKRDDLKAADNNTGEGQLKSYMAASSVCRYGLWVGIERNAYQKDSDGSLSKVTDIPRAGMNAPKRPERKDLSPSNDLSASFRRCHNYIHVNAGMQKAEAFHEMQKLIFCKMYDEELGSSVELSFSIDPSEQKSLSGQRMLLENRIAPLFERVKLRHSHIFDKDERIKLEPGVLAYIVAELQFVYLTETGADIKGAAYEELVGENLRGDRGEYFSPRNVCDMTVRMIQSLYPVADVPDLTVLDCCCGTGGFLVSWIDNLRRILREQEIQRGSSDVERKVAARVRELCGSSVYGLDINPFLVRTAQMNLVMHGDGSSNIFRADSSKTPGEWSPEARRKTPYGQVDVVLTNPPFGSEVRIDDPHVLAKYELTHWESVNGRVSIPAEQLFLETAMNFLLEGGILGIVLPDGILNNPSLKFLRSWLLMRGRIIASIDLPKETFSVSGGVNNPSVLIVQKLSDTGRKFAESGVISAEDKVFLSTPLTCGLNSRGKPVYQRHADGQVLFDANGMHILDDEVSEVPSLFQSWLDKRGLDWLDNY